MKTFRETAHHLMRPGCAVLSALMASSCCTNNLWRSTDPKECIEVRYEQMTEAALIEDGFTYTKDDERQFYYVEKSSREKFGNYTLRILGTPVAIAADALICGAVVYGCAASGAPEEMVNWYCASVEQEYH